MVRRHGCVVLALFGFVLIVGSGADAHNKKEKDPLEGKKGTVVGTLVGKTETSIELKADGEEKARKYVPQWRGGVPAQGGGPDKDIVKIIKELKLGSRLEVDWLFEERLRCMSIKVLKAPEKK